MATVERYVDPEGPSAEHGSAPLGLVRAEEGDPVQQALRAAGAVGHGARIVDERHWDGLPDGSFRRTTTGELTVVVPVAPRAEEKAGPLTALLHCSAVAGIEVGRRPLSVYDQLTGTRPFTVTLPTEPEEPR